MHIFMGIIVLNYVIIISNLLVNLCTLSVSCVSYLLLNILAQTCDIMNAHITSKTEDSLGPSGIKEKKTYRKELINFLSTT